MAEQERGYESVEVHMTDEKDEERESDAPSVQRKEEALSSHRKVS